MEPQSASAITVAVLVKHGVIALFGGIAHAINKHRTGQSKGFLDFMLLTVMSSFFGVLFGFIALSIYPANEYITMAFVGTGGWLGIEGTTILMEFAKRILPGKQ